MLFLKFNPRKIGFGGICGAKLHKYPQSHRFKKTSTPVLIKVCSGSCGGNLYRNTAKEAHAAQS
jgi:hypothetical protein